MDAPHAADASAEGGSQSLSDAEYERELEALRKISADATRELEMRQAARSAASRTEPYDTLVSVDAEGLQHVSAGGMESPWMGSSHGAADE